MGVTGDKIDLFARLISISDIYDALVTERLTRNRSPPEMPWR